MTINECERDLAGIPLEATDFCWAYPLTGLEDSKKKAAVDMTIEPSDKPFIEFGGFMYFDKKGQCLQASSIAPGGGLDFLLPGTGAHVCARTACSHVCALAGVHVHMVKRRRLAP